MVLQIDRDLGRDERGASGVPQIPREPALSRAGRALRALASLELALASLSALMLLVVLCTLAQAKLGLWGAVDAYIRSILVWADIPGTRVSLPVFPGGGLVGLVLLVNLTAAQFLRLEWSRRKAGLWFVHLGLVLLFVGEFATGFLQQDMNMVLQEGASSNFLESSREVELAVIDAGDPGFDEIYSMPERAAAREGRLEHERWPFSLVVKRYFPNAALESRQPGESGPASIATVGVGPQVVVIERPRARGDERDQPAVFVEALSGDRSYGTWLLSTQLGAEQGITLAGREWRLALRHKRRYLPFSVTLKKFRRELHPGTEIPRHFSSLVRLQDPERKEDREVLISMNQPLRYGGQAFYQAGFDQNDTVSILQVVRNPSWLLPYLSCLLVGLGLLVHFLQRFAPKRGAA
ncbi:MAG: cytochrome c biogenesis protein ResB [Elusimicrobia bacterium]|nr:cytochrome c biogenesis protein ResB [Elusimicrobiota bacterium]